MSVRRLAPREIQPESFAFTPENEAWAAGQIAKFPEGRQASAVIPLLWRAQEQAGGWVPQAAIEAIAARLDMAVIRVMEIATFYTMFNLSPVGRYFVQLCGTTPCQLRGAGNLRETLEKKVGHERHVTADGNFSWLEVECLGACCNAPMVQINADYYEDLTPESLSTLLDDLAAGRPVKPGPQAGRVSSEPEGGLTTLGEATLYDGSVVGAWRQRFEDEKRKAAEKKAADEAAKANGEKAGGDKPAGVAPGADKPSGGTAPQAPPSASADPAPTKAAKPAENKDEPAKPGGFAGPNAPTGQPSAPQGNTGAAAPPEGVTPGGGAGAPPGEAAASSTVPGEARATGVNAPAPGTPSKP